MLNAAQDQAEAAVVARAGERGAVTIATNMAGRGTDIRLGGVDEVDRDAVVGRGGLFVIATNHHESRRVDRQLRGRAGRQGDPGESQCFVSLEDDLLVRHGGLRRLLPASLVPERQDTPVENPVIRQEIGRAQRVIEGQHWDIRRTLARYAAVVEDQFAAVVTERRALIAGQAEVDVWRAMSGLRASLASAVGDDAVDAAERRVRVGAIDRQWRRHLAHCAELREGAHLARLGGREPLQVYTSGALASFEGFGEAVDEAVRAALPHVVIAAGALDASAATPPAPTSTWTYLVNDDPFRHTMGSLLAGPGGPTIAAYAAALLGPLLLLWGVADRWLRPSLASKRKGAGQ